MRRVVVCSLVALIGGAVAEAAPHYLGTFTSCDGQACQAPADTPTCGPAPTPCATLTYWNQRRRASALSACSAGAPCTVRLAPGTYVAPAGSSAHCLVAQPETTYEGRTAADAPLNDFTSVVIDLAQGDATNGPCYGRGVMGSTTNFTRFTVRDLQLAHAQTLGIQLRSDAAGSDQARIERVWVDDSTAQGIQIESNFQQDIDCSTTGRRTRNITIADSKVTRSQGVGAGIGIGCVEAPVIERTEVADTMAKHCSVSITNVCTTGGACPAGEACIPADVAFCRANRGHNACDDHDGIQFQGVKGGVIRESNTHHNGEDNIDIGGHWKKTYDVVVERNEAHTAGSRNLKVSGGAVRVIVRNNVLWDGVAEFASCTSQSRFENNTVWASGTAFQGWTHCDGCVIRNNILRSNSPGQTVFLSAAWTNPTNLWQHNVVINEGGGHAVREFAGNGTCDASTCSAACPTPWPASQTSNRLTNAELARFQAEGGAGLWFGPGTGQGDRWGAVPLMVDQANPNAANLHLASADAVAQDAGQDLSATGFARDLDGDTRPQGAAWDVGADEVTAGGPGASGDLSTYLGGAGWDVIRDVAFDRQGNIVLAGATSSPGFPANARRIVNGGTCPNPPGSGNVTPDVLVVKLDPTGRTILWSTVVGGPCYDRAYSLEVDGQGSVFIAGRAGQLFPTTPGVVQPGFNGSSGGPVYGHQNAFVAKLAPDGALLWATYLGTGHGHRDVALDPQGRPVVPSKCQAPVGGTQTACPSTWFDPDPARGYPGGYRRSPAGPTDEAFIKLSADGLRVDAATFGADNPGTPSIRTDSAGNVVFLTTTQNAAATTTPGAYDTTPNGGIDVYLVKFNPDLSALLWGTWLGGADVEFSETHGLAIDPQNRVVAAITTKSPGLPVTAGAAQPNYGGTGGSGTGAATNYPGDGYLAKISSDGRTLVAATYHGGSLGEGIEGVGVDAQGRIYISGATFSTDLPTTPGAFQTSNRGAGDLFAAIFSPDLTQRVMSTYLGGSGIDFGRTSMVHPGGVFVVAGESNSTNWPTMNPLQPAFGGGSGDSVFARFSGSGTPAALPGDLNADGAANSLDLQAMVNVLLGLETDPAILSRADLDASGQINAMDLQQLINLLLSPV